jgi:penicillin-binding protein 1A
VGAETVAAAARRLGVAAPFDPTLSITLGTFETTLYELTGAYAAFATGGIGVWPYAIEEIRDADGALLYRREGAGPGRVMNRRTAAEMNDILHAVVESGTGRRARIADIFTAGKTGTSQDFRDAWFIGYTPQLVTGVWMGNDDGRPMDDVAGGTLPAELWYEFASRAITFLPDRPAPAIAVAEPAPEPRADSSGGGSILERLFEQVRREFAGQHRRGINQDSLGR